MEIKPPTADELAQLTAQHVHRFPEKFSLSMPGDRGSTVKIPVLIGNPTGACKMPLGERPSAAWSNFIAALFQVRPESAELERQAAADCLLWPTPIVWSQVAERWPGAPSVLWKAASKKCGASLALMDIPEDGDPPPPPIAAELDRYPRAVWRILNPPGQKLAVVIDSPKSIAWSFFSDAMKKDDADRWALVCELSQMAVPAAVRIIDATMAEPERYEPVNFVEDIMSRWPGFALHVAATLSYLAGRIAKVEREGW